MNELAWVKEVVDLYFAPWGAAKAARFEALTGDKPFDPEVVLKLIHEKLAALDTRPCDAKTPGLGPVSDEMIETACAAYAKATDYYVPFHRGLSSESSDRMRKGMRAALAALAPGNAGAVAPGFTSSWQEELSLSKTMDRIGNAGALEALRPRLIDNDLGEITVTLNGRELRGWSYKDDAERRVKMLAAREYVEGWCDGRDAR